MSRSPSSAAVPTLAILRQGLMGPTVEDLLARLGHLHQGAPPLLALSILAQLLRHLQALHLRGAAHGAVTPENLVFRQRTVGQLLADPTRDPRLVLRTADPATAAYLAPEVRDGHASGPAADVWSAGAVLEALLRGRPRTPDDPPPGRPFAAGLDGAWTLAADLTARARRERPNTRDALHRTRELALQHLADWDRERTAGRLGNALDGALAIEDDRRVAEVVDQLAEVEPASDRVVRARDWLDERRRREAEIRHRLTAAVYRRREREAAWQARRLSVLLGRRADGDADLAIAQRWLDEAAVRSTAHRVVRVENRRKLLWTAAPLAAALLLVGLLSLVFFLATS